ncbi:MAG: hypothetical protein BWY12_01731 [candidate division BRC1 bacterium ADurb.Bin183]|nr:MAG: hypothetical protein BWY12_01731 [candidate division BRC1 bacterium ADurb.Bin183]
MTTKIFISQIEKARIKKCSELNLTTKQHKDKNPFRCSGNFNSMICFNVSTTTQLGIDKLWIFAWLKKNPFF